MTAALMVVAIWSAAEAAIFFLVADVPISWITVRSGIKAGLIAALVAAAASVIGALAVLGWAGNDPAGASATMTALPGIDGALVAKGAEIYRQGPLATLLASFSGTPFKLIALEAAKQGGYGLLLLAPFLRFPRFVAVTLFVGIISRLLQRRMNVSRRLWLLGCLWTLFYAFYFAVMPS